jgi:predicted DCC family thiol-disulfide oxidoreductase YuxK
VTLVFYDGVCGLCDRLVHFLLARDDRGRFRFAQLQGESARRELGRRVDPAGLDTVFVIADWGTPDQRVLERSRAVLYALSQLGRAWAMLARIGRVVPTPVADVAYNAVARLRYRLFGRFDVCPVPRAEWRDRFLD